MLQHIVTTSENHFCGDEAAVAFDYASCMVQLPTATTGILALRKRQRPINEGIRIQKAPANLLLQNQRSPPQLQ